MDEMTKDHIQKASQISGLLNEELASLVPTVFQSRATDGMGFRGLWQQTDVHTDQLTPENELLEIQKMFLEAKRAWCDLMIFSLKQGRVIRLTSPFPIIKVTFFERPSGEKQYVGQLRAAFATEEEIQAEN